MNHLECRLGIGGAVLFAAGMQLIVSANDCLSAERDVVPPALPPSTKIVRFEPKKATAPIILPDDSQVSEFWTGPRIPFYNPRETADEALEGLKQIPERKQIPESSKHWSQKPSVFEDALVQQAEYPVWGWHEEYESAPKRLDVSDESNWTDEELARLQRGFRDSLANGRIHEASRILRILQSKGACTEKELTEMDLVLHDARYGKTSSQRHRVGYTPEEPALYRRVFRSGTQPKAWDAIADDEVSFHFQGASLSEVASYFHVATGATVRIELTAAERLQTADVYIRCRNQPVEKGLRVVLGSLGLGYVYGEGELVIASPETIRQAVRDNGGRLETHWRP